MRHWAFRGSLFALPLLFPLSTVAHAQATDAVDAATSAQSPPPDAGPAVRSKDWEFSTVTYGWFAGAEGDIDVIGPVEPVGLDLSFGDVLDAFKFAFMGAAEARRDRLILMGDILFFHLGTDKGINIRNQDFLDAELDSRTLDITAMAGYRVTDKGPLTVDLLAGGRLNFLKNTLQLEGPNRSEEGEVKETWLDPLVAARANVPLGGKVSMTLYGDIGGFGVGSDVTWQAIGTVNYNISPKWRLMGGYRYFQVDYDKGDFLYDVAQKGPIVAVRYTF